MVRIVIVIHLLSSIFYLLDIVLINKSSYRIFIFKKSTHMNSAEQMPEYDITEDLNDAVKSGVQHKQEMPAELGEHIQELQDGEGAAEARELLEFILKEAQATNEPEAIITCQREEDEACRTLEEELKEKKELGVIATYSKDFIGGKPTFTIILIKSPREEMDQAA